MGIDPRATTQPEDEKATGKAGGAVVGERYELVAMLGAGGMGNVYKARDLELDEHIALKVLRPEVAGAPGAIERFRREVKLARRVTHPNVARVFDIGEQGGAKILTMELVDGESLGALLEREGPLSVTRAVDISCAICAGVGAAHDAGVVHRDLKPDNVLLAKDGRIVVTDFGIARAAQGGDASKTLGGFVGTPAYMAPEQVEGGEVDSRADVYAFGAMLYEMLTGSFPWEGESPIAVAAARLVHPPPDPRELRPDLDRRIAELVLHCLARKPEDRPAKMSHIAGVLATITATASGPTIPPPRPEPALATGDKRVAVLPFRNLGSAEDEYVADGLTDDLIDLLSIARGLRVHSRGVVARYKGVDRDARQIGRELDVQVVVEGSIRKVPGSFRITARLISVADGLQLWAKRFNGAEADMLTLNDQVARAVADALTADLGKEDVRTADAEAIDLYLRARLQYLRNYFSDSRKASELFAEALARAPNDPRIIAGYVMAQARAAPDDATRRAVRAEAERAIKLAPLLADTHLALGATLFQALDEVGSTRSFRRALRLNANSAEAHDFLGRLLEEADGPEARRHLEIAITLEPSLVLPRVSLIRNYALCGEWERVDDQFATADFEPRLVIPHQARLILWRRDEKLARELLGTFTPDAMPLRTAQRILQLAIGERLVPEEVLVTPSFAGPRLKCFYAQLHAEAYGLLGDAGRALDAIERAGATNLYDIAWLERCPLIELVRGDPRYETVRTIVSRRAAAVRSAYAEPDS